MPAQKTTRGAGKDPLQLMEEATLRDHMFGFLRRVADYPAHGLWSPVYEQIWSELRGKKVFSGPFPALLKAMLFELTRVGLDSRLWGVRKAGVQPDFHDKVHHIRQGNMPEAFVD